MAGAQQNSYVMSFHVCIAREGSHGHVLAPLQTEFSHLPFPTVTTRKCTVIDPVAAANSEI